MSKTEIPEGEAGDVDEQPETSTAERIAAVKTELRRMKEADEAVPHRPPRWWGAVVGIVAAGCGLAVGEVVAGFSRVLRSPVVSVGDRVIDRVPKSLKNWAIRTFGTSDKTVLVWTIVVVIAIAAMLVGVAVVRMRRGLVIGAAFAALFGILGAAAGGFGRNTSSAGIFPSLVAALVAGAVLFWGHRLAHPRADTPSEESRSGRPRTAREVREAKAKEAAAARTASGGGRGKVGAEPMVAAFDRRRFLLTTGSLAVGAAVVAAFGRSLQDRFSASLERAGVRLPVAREPLPPLPADPAALVENEGLATLQTPIKSFYRIDTALSFPSVSLSDWKLGITGMVEKRISFTYDDLLNRDLIERDITISCVSNEVGGGLIGNARWIGCRLDELLAEAGIKPEADQVMGISVDDFTAGFPVQLLDGRDALVAIGMNGEPLPVKNGFPARLVVPGIYGYVSAVKWLDKIKLTRFDAEEGYWVPRGWAALAPVKTQSRIDRPRRDVVSGETHIAGVAWAVHRGIQKVEVQVDEQEWVEATLGPVLSIDTWVQWWVTWDATPGRHRIRVRATDGDGETQTEERTRVDPDGATGWHTISVDVDG